LSQLIKKLVRSLGFVVTKKVLQDYLEKHGEMPICYRCREPVRKGETITASEWAHTWQVGENARLYHVSCLKHSPQIFAIYQSALTFYENKHGHGAVCPKCAQPIKANQTVKALRKRRSRKQGTDCATEYYHVECWKSLFI
jgi:hypothetical protein